MMSDTESEHVPVETVTAFLNAARDGYVDTTETRFSGDGTGRIVLTHTHQGAFKTTSRLARRFGLIPDGTNTNAAGQRYQHRPGSTPTLRVAYDPDACNVVMVKDGEVQNPPLMAGQSRERAVEGARRRRGSDDTRSDVEFRVQHSASQELIAIEDELETMTDGGTDTGNPSEVSEGDLPDSAPDILADKITAALNLALDTGDVAPDTSLVEAASMSGLKYEALADIAREMDLDVDAMNMEGLGIADSEDDIQPREPDGWTERPCGECGERTTMDYWKGEWGGVRVQKVQCRECDGEGAIFPGMTPTAVMAGVLADPDGERAE